MAAGRIFRYPDDYSLEAADTPRLPIAMTLNELLYLEDRLTNDAAYNGYNVGTPLKLAFAEAKLAHVRRLDFEAALPALQSRHHADQEAAARER